MLRMIAAAVVVSWALAAQQPQGGLARLPSTTGPELNEMLQRVAELLASGRYEEMRRQLEKLLRRAETLGPESKAVALAWLGVTYSGLGRFAEAERTLLHCLELRERLWGGANQADLNHGRILTVLAGAETELRFYQQAEKRFEEALRIWNSIPGSHQGPEFGAYLNNLGMLRYGQGRYLEAERCLREAVTIFEQFAPRDERRLAQAMAHLAGTLSRLKLHTEADALSNQALARFEDRLAQNPLLGSELLSVRAFVLRKAKRGREAKPFQERARDLQRKTGAYYAIDISTLSRCP